MNQEQDYASDSDQSDEDFCPDKEVPGDGSDAASEDDSGDEDLSDREQAQEEKVLKTVKKGKKRGRKPKKRPTKKLEEKSSDEEEDQQQSSRRSTRQTEGVDGNCKGTIEKDVLESDEEEKSRTDALWADFLSDVNPTASASKKTTTTTPARSTNGDTTSSMKASPAQVVTEKPKQVTVTEVVDFAGEEVRVQKVVSVDSIKENKLETSKVKALPSTSPRIPPTGVKRPAGGLGSIMNQIGKKKKISVLEKTKLDWNSFKEDEGIDEEIQTFNKGKDGYLERQDFLQRTDLRQFEIEKNLRQSKRNH